MKNNVLIVFILSIACCNFATISAKGFFKNITSLFNSRGYEETIQQEITISPSTTVSIENPHGNIYVKTEWQQNTIALSATKHGPSVEITNGISLVESELDTVKTIKTTMPNKSKGSIDLTLIVPTNISLELITNRNNITVEDGISGNIIASTQDGIITLNNTRSTVQATAQKAGSIHVRQAEGDISAKTDKGNITITDSKKNVVAETNRGTVNVTCKELAAHDKMWIKTTSGAVMLDLPQSINANMQAKTKKGTVTCDLPITIKEKTTQLNKQVWKQFRQEVEGNFGNGNAEIKVAAQSSSIKIRKRTA
ncbi:MAG TPA: DUF4097 family beta strand repeat-containing protein [Candidatus Babeliales bacterium]|nr:DUF4097 family beta strand repeat-containing protein [Candidatus Babeliales bacterium]